MGNYIDKEYAIIYNVDKFKYFLSREVEGPGPMTPSNPCICRKVLHPAGLFLKDEALCNLIYMRFLLYKNLYLVDI